MCMMHKMPKRSQLLNRCKTNVFDDKKKHKNLCHRKIFQQAEPVQEPEPVQEEEELAAYSEVSAP